MEETKEYLVHDYNCAVDSFNGKDYVSFFRNIRPAIERLSQYLIFDFMDDETDALDLIKGNASITKDLKKGVFLYSSYRADRSPSGRQFCVLFPKVYYCKHRELTTTNATDQKKHIKRALDSCSEEMCRFYSIASEMGSHAGRPTMDIEIQANACAAFVMGFLDFITSNRIVSDSAVTFFRNLNKFVFGEKAKSAEFQSLIDDLVKESEEKEAAMLTAQKMQAEAEQNRLLAEQRAAEIEQQKQALTLHNKELELQNESLEKQKQEFELLMQEYEQQIKQLQSQLDSLSVTIDLHPEQDSTTEGESAQETSEASNEAQSSTSNVESSSIRPVLQGTNNWDVSEETMDDEQLDLIEYTDDKSMLVAGCAGSGKSVIAMHKAEQLSKKGKDVILIAYTKSLSRFMANGSADPSFKFYHHHLWKYKYQMPKADYIIVDEIQDFTKEEIQEFINAARKHFLFFGDTAQSIYRAFGKQTLSVEQIENMTGLTALRLYNNYRLPRPVAKVTQDYVGVNVAKYSEKIYQNRETELPHFVHFDFESDQIDFLLNLVYSNEGRSIGILLPRNEDVLYVCKAFKDNDMVCEFKYNGGDGDFDYVDNLDFNSSLPKIMTYHSAKGLQFDVVILPMYNGVNSNELRKSLYVAMTRTMHTLYVLYSTPELTSPLGEVPSHLYLKE